jgi:adenine phosphoribosyltransferase
LTSESVGPPELNRAGSRAWGPASDGARGDMQVLKEKIRHVPDFPKPGILFYDVTTLLRDAEGFKLAIDALTAPYEQASVGLVVGIESRGFILGAAVADRLGAGFVPIRKVGKLPSATVKKTYDLEYGTDSLEMHRDAIDPGQNVLIVDDLLATGGTARAAVDLVKEIGGRVAGVAFLIELVALNGRQRLNGENLHVVLSY